MHATHTFSPNAKRITKLGRSLRPAIAILAITFGTPTAFPKGEPLDVQGSVEVLNDSLDDLFMQTVTSDSSSVPRVTFNIPDGKRLIVETIAFRATSATTDVLRVILEVQAGGTTHTIYLPVQFTLPEGLNTVTTSLLPVKFRIDAVPGDGEELAIQREFGASGLISATISGYLVDL
jgi:hypothetical protein